MVLIGVDRAFVFLLGSYMGKVMICTVLGCDRTRHGHTPTKPNPHNVDSVNGKQGGTVNRQRGYPLARGTTPHPTTSFRVQTPTKTLGEICRSHDDRPHRPPFTGSDRMQVLGCSAQTGSKRKKDQMESVVVGEQHNAAAGRVSEVDSS